MLNLVTGAFGFTGKYISDLLIKKGEKVRTLTSKTDINLYNENIEVFQYNFEDKEYLIKAMSGAEKLFNTYWIRFPYKSHTFEKVVFRTKILIDCAKEADIKKIIHISVSNANSKSKLNYFKYKGIVEEMIKDSKIDYFILRPTIIFGKESILINNIAWFLRKFPIFIVFGKGKYLVQPIFIEDIAKIAVLESDNSANKIIDIVGPEVFEFKEMVNFIKTKISSKCKILYLPTFLFQIFIPILNFLTKDVVLTKEELKALKENLLYSKEEPIGQKKFTDWIEENKFDVGKEYFSELLRHYI